MKHKIIYTLLLFVCIFCLFFAAVPSLLYFIWNIGVFSLYGSGITLVLILKYYKQLFRWFQKHKRIRRISILLLVLSFGAFCYANGILFTYAYHKQPSVENEADTLVVLGCQIINDQPSLSLRKRLDKAFEYLDAHPLANCIVTGGIGKGKAYSEAEIMKRYLTEKGIDASRIYLEDRSTGTRENLSFAMMVAQRYHLPTNFIVVSDNYHQYRAAVYLKQDFAKTASHLSANGPWGIVPCYWIREVLGVFYLFLAGM